jgi:hypothetical protein
MLSSGVKRPSDVAGEGMLSSSPSSVLALLLVVLLERLGGSRS